MGSLGRSSFRRILLSRILLLSIPVLLLGEVVIYRKARSSLLDTVHQNLAESAIGKGQDIQESIKALQANLITASQIYSVQSSLQGQPEKFLRQLQQRLSAQVQCLQLTNLQTGEVTASTCGDGSKMRLFQKFGAFTHVQPAAAPGKSSQGNPNSVSPQTLWPQQQTQLSLDQSVVYIAPAHNPDSTNQSLRRGQLKLILSSPVYDQVGQLQYALSAQIALQRHQLETDKPGSLSGYTVVIDQDGTILAHPSGDQVGRNIHQEENATGLQTILNQAIDKKASDVHHLYSLGDNKAEWLAGYTSIKIPISGDKNHTWVVLAVTRWDNALHGLEGIKQILVVLTLGLVTTIVLATLYMARELSLPLEQLGNYALQIQRRHSNHRFSRLSSSLGPRLMAQDAPFQLGINSHLEPAVTEAKVDLQPAQTSDTAPMNFKVQELNQLAEALNSMVTRLEERAAELETAWQEAEAANKLKSEFLANTSHELRTPLNAIIGCVRLVRDGCCDDREEEIDFLQRADEAAIHLLNVINDLLDIAKIEAGTLSIAVEPVELGQVLNEVINLQAVHIQQKGLELSWPDLADPIIVRADLAKLKQVLFNVIGNAIKFTESGGITITTRIELLTDAHLEESPAAAYAIVTVADTGIGIELSQQSKLFRPFVMVDGTTTRKYEGTGLGLAISRNLMHLMGGDIVLHSAGVGQGTIVEIILPLSEALPFASDGTIHQAVSEYYVEVTSSL